LSRQIQKTVLRPDPLSGRLVAIAPGRARRPGAGRAGISPPSEEELDECPFCAGRENRTPPETLVLPEAGPWQVRVVPNLYPAVERQEVVVHTPEHLRSLAELDDAALELVAEAWQRRRAEVPGGYLQVVVNEGREAGSSLPHTHSQLVWLPEAPPATQHGVDRERWSVVAERDGLVLACPYASRLPYECVVVPAEPRHSALGDELLGPALRLLGEGVRHLHAIEGAVPLNAWLHDGPDWHLELLPRLTVLAGLELGAEVYVNTLAPESAAAALREAGT
jgi:UDPglucose--hexose-1-phosphate uridylyltransferase